LSDVVGDRIDVIGSGPTATDDSTFGDALDVLREAGIDAAPSVQRVLRAGARGELEAASPLDGMRVTNLVLAGNETAVEAARRRAEADQFRVIGTHRLEGEARICGAALAARAAELCGGGRACIVAGGETTVTVTGHGIGGRNLEVALGAIEPLSRHVDALLMTLATDGEDGPTDAAGAAVTTRSAARAEALGLDLRRAARQNDTLALFDALHDVIHTGPTGTNVCDLALLLA
jgi:hydroxypyruvate reductase